MKINFIKITLVIFFSFSISFSQNNLPRVFSGDANKLLTLRESYLKGDLKNDARIKYLTRQADKLLDQAPLSVTDKKQEPPSGDKHDYLSMGKYWWPNPDTKDGLPYIRKDGVVNPESNEISDPEYAGKMSKAVEILSVAYYVTNNKKYSSKASELLTTWFLDERTKMNPHMNYAQYIPGRNEGRGSGIIDIHNFYRIIDAVGLLESSGDWTTENDQQFKKWIEAYLLWLQTSANGMAEAKAKNNHGCWYDVQVVSYLLILNKNQEAKDYLENITKKRIDSQIKDDGKQPEELTRTNSLSYSLFNLKALFRLAVFGDIVGVDLWNYKNSSGGTMRKALDFILPFISNPSEWEYEQITEFTKERDVYPLLQLAKNKFDDKIYSDWITKILGAEIKPSIDDFL